MVLIGLQEFGSVDGRGISNYLILLFFKSVYLKMEFNSIEFGNKLIFKQLKM